MKKLSSNKRLIIIFLLIVFFSVTYKLLILPLIFGANTDADEVASKNKTQVSIWLENSNEAKGLEYQIKKYNKENKDNIFIKLDILQSEYDNLLKIALASRVTPDIFQYEYNTLLVKKQIKDLSTFNINLDSYGKENFMYYNGKPYGIIFSANKYRLLINDDLLRKAGIDINAKSLSWDDINRYSELIKKNLPDVTPIEMCLNTVDDLTGVVGLSSLSTGNIYPTFWNFKDGKYDFGKANNTLSMLNKMYKNGFMSKDIETMSREDVITDFYNQYTAMIISSTDDDFTFKNFLPLSFNYRAIDIPQADTGGKNYNYYYTDPYNCLVANDNTKHKKAVGKVLEWLMSEKLQEDLSRTGTVVSPLKASVSYDGENQYKYGVYDPDLYVNHSGKPTIDLLLSAITGKTSVESVTEQLNNMYNSDLQRTISQTDLDIQYNKEK